MKKYGKAKRDHMNKALKLCMKWRRTRIAESFTDGEGNTHNFREGTKIKFKRGQWVLSYMNYDHTGSKLVCKYYAGVRV